MVALVLETMVLVMAIAVLMIVMVMSVLIVMVMAMLVGDCLWAPKLAWCLAGRNLLPDRF